MLRQRVSYYLDIYLVAAIDLKYEFTNKYIQAFFSIIYRLS